MPASPGSLLSRTDHRPVLVSVLGGAWIVMCSFGLLRGVLLVAGLSQGAEVGAHDPNVELAKHAPELVDPAWFEAQAQKQELLALERRYGVPLIALSLLGGFGGVWLLMNRRHARTLLLLAGVGVIAMSAWYARQFYVLTTTTSQPIAIPEDAATAMWVFAVLNVALQSLPVVTAMGLLRHPSLNSWVRAGRPAEA